MRLLRECHEGYYCKLNAIITFREWLDDFATPETKRAGEALIQRELEEAMNATVKPTAKFREYYTRTVAGERDLYL